MKTSTTLARIIVLVLVACSGTSVEAGSYFEVPQCDNMNCTAAIPLSQKPPNTPLCKDPDAPPGNFIPCPVTPFAITHPLGFTGAETLITLDVCLEATESDFVPALQRAICTWNRLVATTGNCVDCESWEVGPQGPGVFSAESTFLHELGHCAMGLGHIERPWDRTGDGFLDRSSYAWSLDTARIIDVDGVVGNFEDKHEGTIQGSQASSNMWFRIQDNNPAIVDATVIDVNTYSRSVQSNLPLGDSWAASGNRTTNSQAPISIPDTQSVMYGNLTKGRKNLRLAADDVDMVKMGMTGENLTAGDSDDYTIVLNYVGDCSNAHDLRIRREFLGAGALGECNNLGIDYSFPPFNPVLARHFSLVSEPEMNCAPNCDPEIVLNNFSNPLASWDLGTPDLSSSGTCPGAITLDALELAPLGQVAVLRANAAGSTPVPGGPCAGTVTGLNNPVLVQTLTADDCGQVSLTATLPSSACGAFVQLVDLTTCGVSNVDNIPQ